MDDEKNRFLTCIDDGVGVWTQLLASWVLIKFEFWSFYFHWFFILLFFYNYYFSLYLCFSLHENITIKKYSYFYNKKNQYTWNLNTQITKVLIWSWKLTFRWKNTSKCWKIPVGPRGAHVYTRRPTNCWIWNASEYHAPLK
jgi:hypothetical protein